MERAKYLQAREKHPEKWNDKFQEQLEDIEARITEFEALEPAQVKPSTSNESPAQATPAYVPAKGTEHLIHAEIIRGHRFNPNTGQAMNKPYIQMFTRAEFRVFQQAAARLGYSSIKVLHKPV